MKTMRLMTAAVLLHGVIQGFKNHKWEITGYSVSTSMAIIHRMAVIELINGVLQTIVLLISIAVGIATLIHTINKIRKPKSPLQDDI